MATLGHRHRHRRLCPVAQAAIRGARRPGGARDADRQKFGFAADHVVSLENGAATGPASWRPSTTSWPMRGMKERPPVCLLSPVTEPRGSSVPSRPPATHRSGGFRPGQLATDAIPMTELQNIAGASPPSTLFSSWTLASGLGLTRGANNANFLRDNAKRLGRQMLTASGADQWWPTGDPNRSFGLYLGPRAGGQRRPQRRQAHHRHRAYACVAPAVAAASPARRRPSAAPARGQGGGDFIFELPMETNSSAPRPNNCPTRPSSSTAKLDAARPAMPSPATAAGDKPAPPPAPVPVVVKDLQGGEQGLRPGRRADQRAAIGATMPTTGAYNNSFRRNCTPKPRLNSPKRSVAPDFALAANNLGFVFYKQEKYKAARWFENTLKLDPSRAIAYLNLGDALAKGRRDG